MKAVVFDLDDTLYPELEFVRSGFRAVAHYLEQRFGTGEKQIVGVLQSVFDGGERQLVFNEALRGMRLPHDDELVEDLVSVYRNHEPAIQPFLNAETVLRTLVRDSRLAVLTDGPSERQLKKIRALGIENYFERIVCTEDRGDEWVKPGIAGFKELEQCFGVEGPRCAYIADNPSKDFLAPNRLGWLTVRVRARQGLYRSLEGSGEYKARFEVGQIVRLIPILKEWSQK